MASANIAQRTTGRPARKPDPSRVVQSYLHIVDTQGKRGALRKTGEIYGISDETVRRYVATYEAAQNVPDEPPELQYVPPPGGYPEPVMPQLAQIDASYVAPIATDEPQNNTGDSGIVTSSETTATEAGPQDSAVTTEELPHAEVATRHSDELEIVTPADMPMPQPVIVRERVVQRVVVYERVEVGLLGWIREHPGAAHQAVAWLIAAVLIGVASLG